MAQLRAPDPAAAKRESSAVRVGASGREAWIAREASDAGDARWVIGGDWVLENYPALAREAARLQPDNAQAPDGNTGAGVDWRDLKELDTAGAALLIELLGPTHARDLAQADPDMPAARRALLENMGVAMLDRCAPPPRERRHAVGEVLERVGIAVMSGWKTFITLLGFAGLVLETLARTVFRPRRWRVTSVTALVEQVALDALPIVALLTFMVGTVVAFLGATVLQQFGATIYTVNLVAFSFLREFGVLLTAILIAGRTASAYTAQIGSMKANEEIDALRALGLNPVEMLVAPRVIALLISLPILTFIGVLAGLLGGALVCLLTLDISLTRYISIIQENVDIRHFLVGMVKAPIFAFVIAIIGCLEGFKVTGSAQSVGEHTTSSVVQSIFMVILLDALAALFFMEMGW
ncbi:ABC-type transport system involved in resistance to organic solvents, permease component USSDB6A [plant metagenome]|uniref:ABC-type transport system involved in resistance to organic solvents, permease component USSDB6A n=1 Tax=plant metagenome TaxID=1297885 RepID=A0A484VED5_9ZZZZ